MRLSNLEKDFQVTKISLEKGYCEMYRAALARKGQTNDNSNDSANQSYTSKFFHYANRKKPIADANNSKQRSEK